MAQGKYWCFTLNNYNEEEQEMLRRKGSDPQVTYLVFGREVGDSGTPHLQGYIELQSRKRFTTLKRWLNLDRIHLERRKGTAIEASDYCKKDGDFEEFGTLSNSNQGKRTDLEKVVDSINEGASIRDLWRDHPVAMIKYEKGIKRAQKTLQEVEEMKHFDLDTFPWHPLELEPGYSWVIWGYPGCGKTHYAKALYPKALFVSHIDDLLNYDPEKYTAIIFDDMDFMHLPRTAQIHLADQDDDRSIHCRYSTATIPANTIKIFVTNNNEGKIFMDDAAINRRIKTYHITDRSFVQE